MFLRNPKRKKQSEKNLPATIPASSTRLNIIQDTLTSLSESIAGTDLEQDKKALTTVNHLVDILNTQPAIDNARNMKTYSEVWDKTVTNINNIAKGISEKLVNMLDDPETTTFDEYLKMIEVNDKVIKTIKNLSKGVSPNVKPTPSVTVNVTSPNGEVNATPKGRKKLSDIELNDFEVTEVSSTPPIDDGIDDDGFIEPPQEIKIERTVNKPQRADITIGVDGKIEDPFD